MTKPNGANTTIGVGVIGLGFMGRIHAAAVESARTAGFAAELVAVYDPRGVGDATGGNIRTGAEELTTERLRGLLAPDLDALLSDPRIELVSICTPTDSHVDLAGRALRAGKNVLLEKPVAISAVAVESLIEVERVVARDRPRFCMPAMCMRFWPGWRFIADRVRDGRFGPLRRLTSERFGPPPTWSRDFYLDEARSGGAIIDLHIHDVDFVRWLLGEPDAMQATGSRRMVETTCVYGAGRTARLASGWVDDGGAPYYMRCEAEFASAVVETDSRRTQPLAVRHGCRAAESVPLNEPSGYEAQMRHAIECARSGARPQVTLDDALGVMRWIEREIAQLGE